VALSNNKLEERILLLEDELNEVQAALNKLATKRQLNSVLTQTMPSFEDLQSGVDVTAFQATVADMQTAINNLATQRQLRGHAAVLQAQVEDKIVEPPEERLLSIESKLNDVQVAINVLATKRQLKGTIATLASDNGQDSADYEERFLALETLVNQLQEAVNSLATRRMVNSVAASFQPQIDQINSEITQINQVSWAGTLDSHKTDPLAHSGIYAHYYTSDEVDTILSSFTTDHGALLGLEDDDHPQYLTSGRAEAEFYTRDEIDTNVGSALNAIIDSKGQPSGIAELGADGKVPNAQLPALAITETHVVSGQTAMLALTSAEVGDVAIRTDLAKSFILQGTDPTVSGNWIELLSPPNEVTSVFGRVGNVAGQVSDYPGYVTTDGTRPITGNQIVSGIVSGVAFMSSQYADSGMVFGSLDTIIRQGGEQFIRCYAGLKVVLYKPLDAYNNYIWNSQGPLLLGTTGTTGHGLGIGDVLVGGILEVKGVTYHESTSVHGGALCFFSAGANNTLINGSSSMAQMHFALGSLQGRQVVFGDYFVDYDFDHDTQVNPTVYIHSATNPNTDNTQWMSLSHNQTDAVISTGKGSLTINASGIVVSGITNYADLLVSGNATIAGQLILGSNVPSITWADDPDTGIFHYDNQIAFEVGGSETARVNGYGFYTVNTGQYYWATRTRLSSPADAVLRLMNNAETSGVQLNFSTTDKLQIRKFDDSALCTLECNVLNVAQLFDNNGCFKYLATSWLYSADTTFGWSSSNGNWNVARDTGLGRYAAGTMKITNGSTGLGNLLVSGLQTSVVSGLNTEADVVQNVLQIRGPDAFHKASTNTIGKLHIVPGQGVYYYQVITNIAGSSYVTTSANDGVSVRLDSGTHYQLGLDNTATGLAFTASSLANAINVNSTLNQYVFAEAVAEKVYLDRKPPCRWLQQYCGQPSRITNSSPQEEIHLGYVRMRVEPNGNNLSFLIKDTGTSGSNLSWLGRLTFGQLFVQGITYIQDGDFYLKTPTNLWNNGNAAGINIKMFAACNSATKINLGMGTSATDAAGGSLTTLLALGTDLTVTSPTWKHRFEGNGDASHIGTLTVSGNITTSGNFYSVNLYASNAIQAGGTGTGAWGNIWNGGHWSTGSAGHISWTNGAVQGGTRDIGLTRDSAGWLRVTDGTTGYGSLIASSVQSNKDVFTPSGMITPEGGHAIRLINKTGTTSVKGSVACADTTTDFAYKLEEADGLDPIGIVYEDGVADGSPVWIVVAGIAQVLLENSTASTRGYWVRTSITVAGRANATNAAPPGGTIGALEVHSREIGHCIESKTAGTNVLAKCVIHFN